MFCSTSFQVSSSTWFSQILDALLGSIRHHFPKKLESSFTKGGPIMKPGSYWHVQWLPERPPRVRTSQIRNNSSSSKYCSNGFPLHFYYSIARKCCLNYLPLQMIQKHVRRKGKGSMSRAHCWWSDTPLAKGWRIIKRSPSRTCNSVPPTSPTGALVYCANATGAQNGVADGADMHCVCQAVMLSIRGLSGE